MGAKKKPVSRAAAKPRVSRVRKTAGPQEGSPDWDLSLIDARHVDTLVKARKVGLPLAVAAEVAGVPAELAQTWLIAGRADNKLGPRRALNGYRELCRDFASQWDRAVPGLITVLRGYLVQHAQKNPQACVQALTTYEREYHQRRPHVARPAPETVGWDLAEPFLPLELGAGPPRSAKFTRTNPDGSTSSAEFSQGGFEHESEEQSDEALAYFVEHGHWPKDAPRPRPASDLEEDTVDTQGEEVAPETDYQELAQALSGKPPPAGSASSAVAKGEVRPGFPKKAPTSPPALSAGPSPQNAPAGPQAPALRRIDPRPGLRELSEVKGGQLVVDADQAPPELPPAMPGPTLRRVDPVDR